jgi:hypothetical protein
VAASVSRTFVSIIGWLPCLSQGGGAHSLDHRTIEGTSPRGSWPLFLRVRLLLASPGSGKRWMQRAPSRRLRSRIRAAPAPAARDLPYQRHRPHVLNPSHRGRQVFIGRPRIRVCPILPPPRDPPTQRLGRAENLANSPSGGQMAATTGWPGRCYQPGSVLDSGPKPLTASELL